MSEVKHRCCGRVYDNYRFYQCSKNGKIERNGEWFCGLHDPVAKQAKAEKQNAKWKAESDARTASQQVAEAKRKEIERRAACFDELVEALKFTAAVCAGEIGNKSGLINALEKARAALIKAGAQP